GGARRVRRRRGRRGRGAAPDRRSAGGLLGHRTVALPAGVAGDPARAVDDVRPAVRGADRAGPAPCRTAASGRRNRFGGVSPTPVDAAEVVAAVERAGRDNPLLGIGTGGDDLPQPTVGELVDAVGAWLRTPERRVAASLVVLGYSARLLGPTLAV